MTVLVLLAMVIIGGGAGAMLRLLITRWSIKRHGFDFPWATLLVNLGGALLIGLLAGFLVPYSMFDGREPLPALLIYGLLGSYTTVSTLSLEWLLLVRRGRARAGWIYLGVSLAGGLLLVVIGLATGTVLTGRLP
jgi:fluoride exporter